MRPNLSSRNRHKRLHLLAGTALTAFAAASDARADSAVGASIPLGTQLNPTGLKYFLPTDPMGLSSQFQNSRTPTGLLYPRPYLYPPMVQSQSNPDWWSSAWAEIGYLGTAGETGTATFREYGDLSAGPVINSAGFLAENRSSALYFSANVGSVGRSDQTYQLTLGRYGTFSATLFFDSIPHVFSTNAKILWEGAGTGHLTLPSGLTPGASTPGQVQSVLAALFPGEVSLTREKAGMALTYTPGELSEVFFRFGYEEREGTRPLGATFGYPYQNGMTELVEPIEYRTFDINAGARFKGETLQANLTYVGSFFRNDIPALVWDNPGLSRFTTGYIPTQGQLALPPDNDYHTIKGDLAWAFNRGRFAASGSYASMKQNSPLLPPTVGTGVINGVTGPIDLANWNTVNALSQDTALAEIETFNGFAQFEYNPTPQLRFNLEARLRNEDNKTNYVAFNPLTGQYGYIAIDGGLANYLPRLSGVYEPTVPGQRVQIRNIPFATDTLTLTAKAAYRFASRDRIELSYANKSIDHSYREIGDATDNRLAVQFVTRARAYGTTRISYEYATLDGDTYTSFPYGPFNTTSLPGYIPRFPTGDSPFTLGSLRKYDIADRTEQALKTQTNFILSEKVDLQLAGNFRHYDYDADYGLKSARNLNLNADLTYQVSLRTNFNIFYSFQFHKRDAANINPNPAAGPDDSAGGPVYPLENAWSEENKDKNHVFGAGLRHQFDTVTIDLNYTFTYGDSAFGYTYASTGAFFGAFTPAEAGNGFPDNTFRHHLLETSLLWKYTANIGIRGYYRLEHEDIEDFHYTGLTQVIDNNIYLAAIPESYTGHVFGVFFQYSY